MDPFESEEIQMISTLQKLEEYSTVLGIILRVFYSQYQTLVYNNGQISRKIRWNQY